MALERLVKAIINDENAILTVSAYLEKGEYGQEDVSIGVPAVINKDGIRELLHLQMSKDCLLYTSTGEVIMVQAMMIIPIIIDQVQM